MMKDVDRIIETHASIQAGTPGNKGLGHLSRAGVLLLCAAWELYVEEVLLECVEHCIKRCGSPDQLPNKVKRAISSHVKGSKHELRPIDMAGDGWMTIYREIAAEWVAGLNTPKENNIDNGFELLIGISNLSSSWTLGTAAVNDFVTARGDVAHRGSDAGNIHMNVLRDTYKVQIIKCAVETDNALTNYIKSTFPKPGYPWNRRAVP